MKTKKTKEAVTAEFVRLVDKLEDKPKGLTRAELDSQTFEIPQGPMFIYGQWHC